MRIGLYAPAFAGQGTQWSGGTVVFDHHGRGEVEADSAAFAELERHGWTIHTLDGHLVLKTGSVEVEAVAAPSEPSSEDQVPSTEKTTKPLAPVQPKPKK